MHDSIFQRIPETITVHLGTPDAPAENITLPFAEYVKNVASSEIYPNWPDNAIRANIYAITTYALNRIFTEWYPSRGYNFDITNSTAYDQAFVLDRDIFENISTVTDELFNDYIVRQGTVNPLFTQFCNGTTSTCNGLSQWGTVTLAEQGLTPYEILQRYYGDDINIIQNAPIENISESYPGMPLKTGDAGNNVEILQQELNRIAQNYPAIPRIAEANGIFGTDTENAVKKFQEIFDLPINGEVDKATWYRIKQYYTGVKSLSELISEGVTLQEAELPYDSVLKAGSSGTQVRLVQYYLDVLAYFNGNIPIIALNGIYDSATEDAVKAFQQIYNLPQSGEIDQSTWDRLNEAYRATVNGIPPSFYGNRAKLYPGYFLSEGMNNDDVTDLQTYLNLIGTVYPEIPEITVTGYFGPQTREAVTAFQRSFGIEPTGAVGAVTWNEIANQYDFLIQSS